MVKHMLDVAPLGVQLRNQGGFDSQFVSVHEGDPEGQMYADNTAIDTTWEPRYDALGQKEMDDFVACKDAFG